MQINFLMILASSEILTLMGWVIMQMISRMIPPKQLILTGMV